jgi:hypothetical protein
MLSSHQSPSSIIRNIVESRWLSVRVHEASFSLQITLLENMGYEQRCRYRERNEWLRAQYLSHPIMSDMPKYRVE